MKNKKIRNIIIAAVILLLVIAAVVAALLFLKAPADPADPSSPAAGSVTSEESDVIGSADGSAEGLREGEFTNSDKNDQKYVEQGELGGSATLGVITPSGESGGTASAAGSIERIDGIW